MEQRLPGKKLAQALKEMKQISRMDFVLFNKKGKMLASTVPDLEEKVQELVVLFAKSMADSQTIQNWIFLKLRSMIRQKTFCLQAIMEPVMLRMSSDRWHAARSGIFIWQHRSRRMKLIS